MTNRSFLTMFFRINRNRINGYCSSVAQPDVGVKTSSVHVDIKEPDISNLLQNQTEQDTQLKQVVRRSPVKPPKSLAGAVIRSQFLRDLVDLGVNLHKISKTPLDLDFITSVRSWDNGPRERLKFLLQIGVPQESLAAIITQNPRILLGNLEDMQVRVNYLSSKKFSSENIAAIICGCPKLLSMSTREIDARLGYFQCGFRLSGHEVRSLIIQSPWLVSWPAIKLKETLETLKDKMGFSIFELKELLLSNSKIWTVRHEDLQKVIEFLHNDVGMSHKKMVKNNQLLTKRCYKMKSRFDFMVYMKRINFDPTKPQYTTYDILWEGSLEDFCNRIHTSVDAYELYLKSL